MIHFDDFTKENIKKEYKNWPQIPDHPYRILIIGGSGSRKTISLFNLISHQSDMDKAYLYPKDPYEAKYQFWMNKQEIEELKYLNDFKVFVENPNEMGDIYNYIEEHDPDKKRNILMKFDDTIAAMLSNKKANPMVNELFIRGLLICLATKKLIQ